MPRAVKRQQPRTAAVRGDPVQTVAERTMADIMEVATEAFAREGLSGARRHRYGYRLTHSGEF